MTSATDVAGATQQAAGDTASTARDEAAAVGSTAAEAAGDVAGTAKEQATAVASEAATQVRDLLEQTKQQVNEQAGTATQKLGESLRSLTEELRAMGEGSADGSGPAAELARTVAGKGDALAGFLDGKQPGELVAELRRFASRSPGTFLLGAAAAGVLAGRMTRGLKADAAPESVELPDSPALPAGTPTAPPALGAPAYSTPPGTGAVGTAPYGGLS